MKDSPIYIYMPSNRLGGSELLFEDIFYWFIDNNYNVFFIDFNHGVISSRLKHSNADRIIYVESISLESLDNALVFTSLQFSNRFQGQDNSGVNVVFLVLHKWHVLLGTLYFRIYKKLGYGFFSFLLSLIDPKRDRRAFYIDNLIATNRIVFFGDTTIRESRLILGFKLEPICLNLPYRMTVKSNFIKKLDSKQLNLCWVGRLDLDLLNPLIVVLNLINKYVSRFLDYSVRFHIIGDGNGLDKLKRMKFEFLELIFVGSVYGKDMFEYIKKYADIGIGRGRVNFDFASVSIPFILVPLNPIDRYNKKQFIYGYEGFSEKSKHYDIESILNDVITDYPHKCNQSFANLVSNYSMNKVMSSILNKCSF